MKTTYIGNIFPEARDQLLKNQKHAKYGILGADNHVGYGVPIGGVLAYESHINLFGVGFDIACGNLAIKTNLKYQNIAQDKHLIAREIAEKVSFGVGRKNKEVVNHEVISKIRNFPFKKVADLADLAESQLGTVGAGNHYVDIYADQNNDLWIGIHFGSRGFGHKIANGFISMAQGGSFDDKAIDTIDAEPLLLHKDSLMGETYMQALALAGDYAYAGRGYVGRKVLEILGANSVEEIHNHHNFAWQESHFGENLLVIRKGSTPNSPNQKSFVGGTMHDSGYIIKGVDSIENRESLYSTIHGAGRVLGRRDAIKTLNWNEIQDRVRKDIVLVGAGADESPECYKKIDEVLGFYSKSVEILHKLTPIIVVMAGDEKDPYKD